MAAIYFTRLRALQSRRLSLPFYSIRLKTLIGDDTTRVRLCKLFTAPLFSVSETNTKSL
jgi:hypothetical protein